MKILGTAPVQISFLNGELPLTFRVYVIENLKYDILLGNDFNKHFKAQFNFDNDTITLQGQTIPMEPFSFHSSDLSRTNPLVKSPLSSNILLHEPIKNTNITLESRQPTENAPTCTHSPSFELSSSIPITSFNNHPATNIFETLTNKSKNTPDYPLDFSQPIQRTSTTFQTLTLSPYTIKPNTLQRVSVSIPPNLSSLAFITLSHELGLQGITMPPLLLRKQYAIKVSLPILNLTQTPIHLPQGFPVANLALLEELPIEETTLLITDELNPPIPSYVPDKTHIDNIISRIHISTDSKDKDLLVEILEQYGDVFAKPGEIGKISCYKHKIKLIEGAQPVKKAPYRKPAHLELFERNKIQELLEQGIIRPSHSPWGMGVVIVEEGHKSGSVKTPRFAIDYRPLNKVMEKDSYTIFNIQTVLDWIGRRSNYISLMDCAKGFWSLPLDEESIPLTAFVSQAGLFEWIRMPFGVANGSAAYSRAMGIILSGLIWTNALYFIDDVILADKTINTHVRNLEKVLNRFRQFGVKLSINKSSFLAPTLKILGHIISKEGIQADPDKTAAINNIPPPSNVKELQHFLGCTGYFRRFIRGYSYIVRPLVLLTKKAVQFNWGPEQQQAYDTLKRILTTPPLLSFYDPNKPIHVYTDASGFGVGAALLQPNEDGYEKPIAFASKTLNKAQTKYSTTEREFLAIYFALRTFHPYLYGRKFIIYTDHKPIIGIKFASNTSKISSRLTTWALLLQEHDCIIKYNKGTQHAIVDGLSRLPLESDFEIEEPILNVSIENLGDLQAIDEDCINIRKIHPLPTKFTIKNDVLYNTSLGFIRPVIPKILRTEILNDVHALPISGHLGFSRSYSHLYPHFYWKTMKKDLYNFIQACESCAIHKRYFGLQAGLLQPLPIPDSPFEFISTDIMGPLPETSKGNKYIINAICHFSKWAEIKAIPDATAETIATFLEEQIFCRHACPKYLLSDNGPGYISKILAAHTKMYGVVHKYITPYNSRGNGLSERLHQTVSRMLSHYVNSQHTNWDQYIHQVQWAYNSTCQKSTKQSPYFILYGKEPSLPYHFLPPFSETSNQQLRKIQEIRENVKTHLLQEQETYKLRVDMHRKPVSYEIGEKVMLKNTKIPDKGLAKRFLPHFMGLFTIHDKMNDLTYVVKCDKTGKLIKTHVNRMKRVNQNEAHDDDDDMLFFNSFYQFHSDIFSPHSLTSRLKSINISSNFTGKFISHFLPFQSFVHSDPTNAIQNSFLQVHNIKTIVNLSPTPIQLQNSSIHTTDPVHISHQTSPFPFTFFQICEALTKSNIAFFDSNFNNNSVLIVGENAAEFLLKLIVFKQTQINQFPQLLTLLIELKQQLPISTHSIKKAITDLQAWFPNQQIVTDSDSDSDSDPEFPSLSQARNDKNNHSHSTSGPSKRTSKRIKYKPHWHSSYVFPKP
jgi:hypothetical protein